jgi:hypothetical protein
LELRSKLPAMMNYYLLSAVSMYKEKVVYYSRCWIEHKQLRPFLTVEKIHSVFFQNTIFAVLAVGNFEKIQSVVFPKMRFDGIKFVFLQIGPLTKYK